MPGIECIVTWINPTIDNDLLVVHHSLGTWKIKKVTTHIRPPPSCARKNGNILSRTDNAHRITTSWAWGMINCSRTKNYHLIPVHVGLKLLVTNNSFPGNVLQLFTHEHYLLGTGFLATGNG